MNIEEVREYCLSLPRASEDMPFGEHALTMKVCDRIFACIVLNGSNIIDLKCDPDYAIELRDRYDDIRPAWHWNKKHWNEMDVTRVNDNLLRSLINHSYAEVVKKLTHKLKSEYPEITTI